MKNQRLSILSIVFLLILISWPVLSYYSLPEGNNFIEQLTSISNDPVLYMINFIVAFLIVPSLIFMLYEFYKSITIDHWSPQIKLLFSLYIIYFVLIGISYASQFLYLPYLIEYSGFNDSLEWYFYNTESICYFINQTAYMIWGIATLLIFTRFLFTNTLLFFTVKILTLSALTQIIATIGLYTGHSSLNSLTFYSGILLFPAAILILIYSLKK